MASQILRRILGSRYLSNSRAFSSASTPIRATLFPGDGIGPEIAESVKQVPPQFSLLIFVFCLYPWMLLALNAAIVCVIFFLLRTIIA
jgi:hypothetical protein